MTAARRDFPVDPTKPLTCVRYTCAGVAIRATADGVFVDGDPATLGDADRIRFERLFDLARQRHAWLRRGRIPSAAREPAWIDTTNARR